MPDPSTSGDDADLALYQFAFSHFGEKVRWALDWKGLDSDRHNLFPGFHARKTKALSGTTQTPILVVDGESVPGSSARSWPIRAMRPRSSRRVRAGGVAHVCAQFPIAAAVFDAFSGLRRDGPLEVALAGPSGRSLDGRDLCHPSLGGARRLRRHREAIRARERDASSRRLSALRRI